MWVNLIILGGLFLIAVFMISYFSRIKCPFCGARNCVFIRSVDTGSTYIEIKKEEVIENYNKEQLLGNTPKIGELPNSVSKRKYTVPGTRYFFDSTYKCNNCGKEFVKSEFTDEEN